MFPITALVALSEDVVRAGMADAPGEPDVAPSARPAAVRTRQPVRLRLADILYGTADRLAASAG
jgi:hypothetical protein